ncbi:MAG TPA: tetratricopeptide repeat protein [Kofleriaceae bacterium]|nr:tetratricopeptide repeat protein [Kofleriaceae bacterium]
MRAITCLVWLGSITATATLAPRRAHGDPAPASKADDDKKEADKKSVAKEYVKAGIAAQSAGDFDTAITMFSKAYQLAPHPTLIFNSAQAHRLAGHKERALAMYRRYLEIAPTGDQAQTARDWIAELDPPPRPAPVKPAPPPAIPAPAPVAPAPVAPAPVPASATPATVASSEPADTGTLPATQALTDNPSRPDRTWKIALGASIGFSAAAIAFTSYELVGYYANRPTFTAAIDPVTGARYPDPRAPTQDDCGKSDTEIARTKHSVPSHSLDRLCSARKLLPVGYALTGVGLAAVAVSTYMLVRDLHARERDAARGHHPRHELAIAPVITRDSSAAVLSLTW